MGDDEIELLEVDAVLLADADGHDEDGEDVLAAAFETRARLVVVHGRSEEALDRRLVQLLRERLSDRVAVGVEEVDQPGHTDRG